MKTSPVFIFHGWTSSPITREKWQPFIAELEQLGYRVSFQYLPGLTQPHSESWDLDQYVDWAMKQVKDASNPIIIGHSFGGQIAIKLIGRLQKRSGGLVLIDSSGIPDNRWYKQIKRSLFWVLAKLGRLLPFQNLLRQILYWLAGEQDYYQASPSQRKTMRKVIREDIRQDARRITVPTLILWGEHDTTTPLWMGKQLSELIQSSQMTVVANARHSPQYTHPQLTATYIDQWQNKLSKDS